MMKDIKDQRNEDKKCCHIVWLVLHISYIWVRTSASIDSSFASHSMDGESWTRRVSIAIQ